MEIVPSFDSLRVETRFAASHHRHVAGDGSLEVRLSATLVLG